MIFVGGFPSGSPINAPAAFLFGPPGLAALAITVNFKSSAAAALFDKLIGA
jgi:hypothetical protein